MRRALAGAVVLALLVAACGRPSAEDTTTTSSTLPEESTTTTSTTTSTTSTTTSTTTTTTIPPTTTTTAPTASTVPGRWASRPLIVAPWGALGWWDGSKWVGTVASLPVSGGEDYQVVSFAGSGIVRGGAPTELCEPVFNPGVELSDPARLGEWPGPVGVAISAPWIVQPHLLEVLAPTSTHIGHARELLASHGLDIAAPIVKQVLRVDLEGDGVNEVVVVAASIEQPFWTVNPGDYSVAFMRKVVDGEVQTLILGGLIATAPGGEGDIQYVYSIGGIGDLNGDGKMEIVLHGSYYEGEWVEIWEYVNDDLGLMRRLSAGCGA